LDPGPVGFITAFIHRFFKRLPQKVCKLSAIVW
jgi:hypothetical protein